MNGEGKGGVAEGRRGREETSFGSEVCDDHCLSLEEVKWWVKSVFIIKILYNYFIDQVRETDSPLKQHKAKPESSGIMWTSWET